MPLKNTFYKNHKKVSIFNDLLLYTMMIVPEEIKGPLFYVKKLKDYSKEDKIYSSSGIDLKDCKYFYDFLVYSGFIENNFDTRFFKISPYVLEIDSIEDIYKIIDNNLTIEQYFRSKKLKKITDKINHTT